MATGALDLTAGKFLATLQMLLAMRTRKFELGHKVVFENMHQNPRGRNALSVERAAYHYAELFAEVGQTVFEASRCDGDLKAGV